MRHPDSRAPLRRALPALLGLTCLAALVQPARATDVAAAAELAKASGCTSCHATAEKIVGPAFKDVAARYKGDKDAAAALAQSIQNGSKGKWGRIPMPPNGGLSAAELKTLATWVLQTPQ
ncbi:MAG TPA: c-type cytochrome [Ramlibacter sp.]|nr:c-type cytochrome [Ramlibacter sp.]